nr:MAG TPA: hypothetical protein [Bacteriophage sp.]
MNFFCTSILYHKAKNHFSVVLAERSFIRKHTEISPKLYEAQ